MARYLNILGLGNLRDRVTMLGCVMEVKLVVATLPLLPLPTLHCWDSWQVIFELPDVDRFELSGSWPPVVCVWGAHVPEEGRLGQGMLSSGGADH